MYLTILLLCIVSFNPESIEGVWFNSDKTGKIKIERSSGEYLGKIVWLEDPLGEDGKPAKDINHPDKSRHSQTLIGLEVMYGFTYDGDKVYSGGRIYDPENGKTYKCKLTLTEDGLKVRGYIGIPALGRTEKWTRAE